MANHGGYGRENNNDDGSGLTANNGRYGLMVNDDGYGLTTNNDGYGLATHYRVIVGEVEWMERSA